MPDSTAVPDVKKDPPKDLEKIKAQEAGLHLDRFDAETIWRLGTIARDFAVERGHAIAIEIRRGAIPVFLSTADNTSANNMDWVRKKSNSTLFFERSTYSLGLEFKHRGISVSSRYGLPERDYGTDGGCFPLRLKNAGLVGCITISGLEQRADHELAVESICKLLGKNYNDFAL
jgi:uncharacterized protein (UPF0303 family)